MHSVTLDSSGSPRKRTFSRGLSEDESLRSIIKEVGSEKSRRRRWEGLFRAKVNLTAVSPYNYSVLITYVRKYSPGGTFSHFVNCLNEQRLRETVICFDQACGFSTLPQLLADSLCFCFALAVCDAGLYLRCVCFYLLIRLRVHPGVWHEVTAEQAPWRGGVTVR